MTPSPELDMVTAVAVEDAVSALVAVQERVLAVARVLAPLHFAGELRDGDPDAIHLESFHVSPRVGPYPDDMSHLAYLEVTANVYLHRESVDFEESGRTIRVSRVVTFPRSYLYTSGWLPAAEDRARAIRAALHLERLRRLRDAVRENVARGRRLRADLAHALDSAP